MAASVLSRASFIIDAYHSFRRQASERSYISYISSRFGNALDANLRVALAAGSRPSHSQAVTLFERELDPDEEIAVST